MGKRRKSAVEIKYEPIYVSNIKKPKPSCFNSKEDFCKKELCEEWYDECIRRIKNDPFTGCDRTCQVDGG